jgi:putative addiction module killer protein
MGLKDIVGQAKIAARVTRASQGNFGAHEPVGEGVCELKINFGPGYRVYYGIEGDDLVLLGGGDKDTQTADIKIAKARWKEYRD